MSTGTIESMSETNPVDYTGYRIDEIVRSIALTKGWNIGEIVQTKPVPPDAKTRSEEKKYTKESETYQEFIERKLIVDAISSQTGQGDYVLRLEEDSSTGTTVYSTPKKWTSTNSKTASFNYVIGVPNDEVISFTPEFDDTLIALAVGSGVITEGVDSLTNEYTKLDIKANTKYEGDEFVRRIGSSSFTISSMGAIAKNLWAKAMAVGYTATLELVGTIALEPMQIISIIVLTPDGFPHHSSGAYLVVDVVDNISGGQWITTATLSRNAVSLTGESDSTTGDSSSNNSASAQAGLGGQYTGDMASFLS